MPLGAETTQFARLSPQRHVEDLLSLDEDSAAAAIALICFCESSFSRRSRLSRSMRRLDSSVRRTSLSFFIKGQLALCTKLLFDGRSYLSLLIPCHRLQEHFSRRNVGWSLFQRVNFVQIYTIVRMRLQICGLLRLRAISEIHRDLDCRPALSSRGQIRCLQA